MTLGPYRRNRHHNTIISARWKNAFLSYIQNSSLFIFFFFNDTATTEIYTLSLHDALPISLPVATSTSVTSPAFPPAANTAPRSEEHTSELQSRQYLVCRLLLEKKKEYYNEKSRNAHKFRELITHLDRKSRQHCLYTPPRWT